MAQGVRSAGGRRPSEVADDALVREGRLDLRRLEVLVQEFLCAVEEETTEEFLGLGATKEICEARYSRGGESSMGSMRSYNDAQKSLNRRYQSASFFENRAISRHVRSTSLQKRR